MAALPVRDAAPAAAAADNGRGPKPYPVEKTKNIWIPWSPAETVISRIYGESINRKSAEVYSCSRPKYKSVSITICVHCK